jgi:hypothetical protein
VEEAAMIALQDMLQSLDEGLWVSDKHTTVDVHISSRMAEFSKKPRLLSNIVASSDSCSDDASKPDAIFASVCNNESVINLDGVMDQVHHYDELMRELLLDF